MGGFEEPGESMLACMLVQRADPLYWPEAPPGAALYIHNVAVRRAAAGRGWLPTLIDWARVEARRAAVPLLRLDTLPEGRLPSLYEGLGFRAVDREPVDVTGRPVIRMECPV